jgi:hypothetical protein
VAAQTTAHEYARLLARLPSISGLNEVGKVPAETTAQGYAHLLATLPSTNGPTEVPNVPAEMKQQVQALAHPDRDNDAEQSYRAALHIQPSLDRVGQPQPFLEDKHEGYDSAVEVLPAAGATDRAPSEVSQPWNEPVSSPGSCFVPNGLPQAQSNVNPSTQSLDELKLAPDTDDAQPAAPKPQRKRWYNRTDSDTLANWRDEPDLVKRERIMGLFHSRQYKKRRRAERSVDLDPVPDRSNVPDPAERRRLQNNFNQLQHRKRRRAEVDLLKQAAMGKALPQIQGLSQPDIKPEHSAKPQNETRDVDQDAVANWRDELNPVERKRLANAFAQRQCRERQRAEYNALKQASMKMAPEMQRLPQSPSKPKPLSQSQDELDVAPVSHTAQSAAASERQAKKREPADSGTVPSCRNGVDPQERGHLSTPFHTRQHQTRRRAKLEAQDQASSGMPPDLQRAGDATIKPPEPHGG